LDSNDCKEDDRREPSLELAGMRHKRKQDNIEALDLSKEAKCCYEECNSQKMAVEMKLISNRMMY
jgi:hypothetical protein